MHNIYQRAATSDDMNFALHVTEVRVRVYADRVEELGVIEREEVRVRER
jgi:hypothetical protein